MFVSAWVYLGILILATSFSVGKAFQRNGWKSRFFWFLMLAVVPYATWAGVQVVHGKFGAGLDVFLFGIFAITGALYYRHFRRLSPGVRPDLYLVHGLGRGFPGG